jgi:hypothetical protein
MVFSGLLSAAKQSLVALLFTLSLHDVRTVKTGRQIAAQSIHIVTSAVESDQPKEQHCHRRAGKRCAGGTTKVAQKTHLLEGPFISTLHAKTVFP